MIRLHYHSSDYLNHIGSHCIERAFLPKGTNLSTD